MTRRTAALGVLFAVMLCSVVPAAAADYTGTATWYATGPGAGHAAAGPKLRVGDWRGRHVSVCHNGKCVRVVLDDWCACGGGHVIDLSDEDFSRLAHLSEGVIRVTVSTTGAAPAPAAPEALPTGPPTDIEVTE